MNKKVITTLVAVTAITTITTGCGKVAKLKTDNKTVLALNKTKITAEDYYNEIKKSSIETLIDMMDKKILSKKYKENDDEKKYINDQISQIKTYYQDEDSYLAIIKQYFKVNSEEELKDKLSIQYKRQEAVKDYVKDGIKDDEIEKYYNENVYGDIKASHILISVNTSDDTSDEDKEKLKTEAYNKAKDIIKKLDSGEDFKKLAKEYSEDSTNAKNGGDLGYFNKDDMDPNFWDAALKLEKDKYTTEPVESAYGYHIILKTGEKKKKSLKSMKNKIKETLRDKKMDSDKTLFYDSLIAIREKNKLTFGDSELEKEYKNYMDNLIKQAKDNTTSQ